ncbi:MAG: aspartate-alanine antiporter [Proteobacteria bacterium]|nr:aspartate-alanine antiporter [Pseudomonadota bacterium]
MEFLHKLFNDAPLLALFLTLSLGYITGKFRIKRFVLGGIAGTLLVGVLIGQIGIEIDTHLKTIFFAMFIYAVGYQGGPQFFQSLNKESLKQLASATIMCVIGLLCVLFAAWGFDLDRGTAAGLAAGGLTQSAIIGTAGDAVSKLSVSPEVAKTMQTNIAVGYAVCYIFGSLGPILMLSAFFPGVMGWDIREEAKKLAMKLGGGKAELEPGQFHALRTLDTRIYKVTDSAKAAGETVLEIFEQDDDAAVETVMRNGATLPITSDLTLLAGDIVAVTAPIGTYVDHEDYFGVEATRPDGMELIEETRDVIISNKEIAGKSLQEVHELNGAESRYGVFPTALIRMGRELPLLSDLVVKRGDELRLVGRPIDLNRVTSKLGYPLSSAAITDFIFFGIGMAIGILLGMVQFKLAGIPVTIGTGGGCLLSGLFFGWLRATHPRFAALPSGASNFLRDFGLAVFVGIVGITAGPQAFVTIKEYGLTLFVLGIGVTIIPQIITFYISYYLLQIKNPVELLGCIAGGRSANPGFAALLEKCGNATPVVPFTVTYTMANIWLTLWGPVIIGVITKNAG